VNTTKIASRTNFILFIAVIVGFVVVLNYLAAKFFARADLTENKVYTISDASKRIMKNLDDLVTIKVFISEKSLPSLAVNISQTIKDLLSEYKAYSGGNLNVEFLDPSDDEEIKREANSLGLQEVSMQTYEKDKQQQIMCFMGLVILYGQKKEIMPVLNNVGNLEYDITSRILKITRTEVKKVGFFFGNGKHMFMPEELAQQQQQRQEKTYNNVKKALQEQFEVKVVSDLKNGTEVPSDIATLVVAGPQSLDDREKFEIDQFLMNGGRLIALIDAVDINTSYGLNATKQAHNTGDLFTHYGARVDQNLVADASHASITYQINLQGMMWPVSSPYPLWVKIMKQGFANGNPAVSGLNSMIFTWASSVTPVAKADSAGNGITVTPLVQTTRYAQELTDYFDLNPQRRWDFNKEGKIFDMAVALNGEFSSFYAGKSIPLVSDGADTANKNAMKPAAGDATRTIIEKSPSTSLVLMGDSDFIIDGSPRENLIFMVNLVEWLTLGDNLISIRSKEIAERSIDPKLSDASRQSIRLFNMILMPLLVVVIGIGLFVRRRNIIRKGAEA